MQILPILLIFWKRAPKIYLIDRKFIKSEKVLNHSTLLFVSAERPAWARKCSRVGGTRWVWRRAWSRPTTSIPRSQSSFTHSSSVTWTYKMTPCEDMFDSLAQCSFLCCRRSDYTDNTIPCIYGMPVLSYVPIPQLSAHEFVPEGYHVGQPIMKKKAG